MNKGFCYINTYFINKFLLSRININENVHEDLVCILQDYLDELKNSFLYLKNNWDKMSPPINYIENIQDYIVKAKFNLLIQVIVNKCIEIEGILIENNYLPNKLKLLVLSKISKVYNIFADINV